MELEWLADRFGDKGALLIGGSIIGALFGAFAQQSRFCLRAAAIEFSRGRVGGKMAVWLIVFSTAIAGTMILAELGLFSATETRQLASPQSLSGAALGGLLFGVGMVLARGCSCFRPPETCAPCSRGWSSPWSPRPACTAFSRRCAMRWQPP